MSIVARIRKLGFPRWYERALIEAHAHLVTCLLGMILAFAGIEMLTTRTSILEGLAAIGLGAIGVALSLFGVSRYARMFSLAQRLAGRATCSSCGTYAAFTLLSGGPDSTDADPDAHEASDGIWLRVKCRKCGNTWTL